METITRNVKDIETADRQALEHVIGQHLADDQQLVIHVAKMNELPQDPSRIPCRPPALCPTGVTSTRA